MFTLKIWPLKNMNRMKATVALHRTKTFSYSLPKSVSIHLCAYSYWIHLTASTIMIQHYAFIYLFIIFLNEKNLFLLMQVYHNPCL